MYQASFIQPLRRKYHAPRRKGPIQGPGHYMYADQTLGFSLNPFKLIGKAIGAIKTVVKGSTVSIPTEGGGTASISTAKIPAILRGAQVQLGAPGTPTQQVSNVVESIPGGWMTLAAVGVGAIVLTSVLSRRR